MRLTTANGLAARARSGPAARAAFAAELALVVALAYALAQLIWAAAPPLVDINQRTAASTSASRAALSIDPRGADPFRRSDALGGAADAEALDAPVTTLNLEVAGVRIAPEPALSVAIIIGANNTQGRYRIGDEIADGVMVHGVEPRRVLIRRDGIIEALPFESDGLSVLTTLNADAAVAAETAGLDDAGGAAAAERAVGRVSLSALAAGLQPAMGEAGVSVRPRGDGAAFAAAGFEPGDVITAINGVRVGDVERLEESLARLSVGAVVEVGLERDGEARTLDIELE